MTVCSHLHASNLKALQQMIKSIESWHIGFFQFRSRFSRVLAGFPTDPVVSLNPITQNRKLASEVKGFDGIVVDPVFMFIKGDWSPPKHGSSITSISSVSYARSSPVVSLSKAKKEIQTSSLLSLSNVIAKLMQKMFSKSWHLKGERVISWERQRNTKIGENWNKTQLHQLKGKKC